jgi:hypothetical protein
LPFDGSVHRRSPSLRGVPRVGSPASTVLRERCDFPSSIPPRFVSFAWWYRGGALLFALAGGGAPRACKPGPLLAGGPYRRIARGVDGISQVPGQSFRACPALGPRGNLHAWPRRRVDAAFRCVNGIGFPDESSLEAESRGLHDRCPLGPRNVPCRAVSTRGRAVASTRP